MGRMPPQTALSNEVLTAALAGLEAQKKAIQEHIASIRSLLGLGSDSAPADRPRRGRPPKSAQAAAPVAAAPSSAPRKRRKMSAEARRRIAEAARRRWAAAKKAGRNSLA